MIRTFPHGLENNHACKCTSDNFPGMLSCVLFLETCQKIICTQGCAPFHVDRSLRVSILGDKSVPYFYEEEKTFPHGLENNHACKLILDNLPGIIHMSAFLKKYQKSIYMHGCSLIHVERSFFFIKVWDLCPDL